MSARNQPAHTRQARLLPRLALAAVVLVCATLAGCTAANSPTAPTAGTSKTPPLPGEGELDAGTYVASAFEVPFEVTVPEGWGITGGDLLQKELSEGMGVFLM